MGNRDKVRADEIAQFAATHPGWSSEGKALTKTFSFEAYRAAIAFVVEIGFAAEARNHHPDLFVTWGRVRVDWSTHDAGGITKLDLEMAEATDAISGG